MADVQAGLENTQDVAIAQRVPRVDDGILAKAHVHPGPVELGHAGDAAAFRVVVETPLQVNALGRAGHEIDTRLLEQAEQLVAVGIVVRAHGHGMAGCHPGAHAAHPCLFGQHFEKARLRVVGLVAMHVHQAAGTLGQVHQELDRRHALVAGVLKMRDAANHVGADGHRFSHQRPAVGVRLDTLLGEGDDLQVEQVAHFVTHFDHGFQRRQGGVGDIDMGTYMLDAMVHQHADGLFRAVLDVVMGGDRLALGPALDAFEQGAAHVPARLAGGQRGVQVNVRFDEGRHHQVLPGIQVIGSARRHPFGLGHDGGDAFAAELDAEQAGLAAQACVDDVHDASPWALRVALPA
ncbi:hypothetical protein D3C79_509840 [compost metagenome]